jgi:hypothetical protein
MSVMGGELALGAERKSSEKTPEVEGKRRTSDCHHIISFSGSRHIPVLMLLRQVNRFASPSWTSRVPSAMPLRAKVTNPAFRATAMVCTCTRSRRETRSLMLILVRCRPYRLSPKSSQAMSPMMFSSTRSTASAALSSTDPRSLIP